MCWVFVCNWYEQSDVLKHVYNCDLHDDENDDVMHCFKPAFISDICVSRANPGY